MIEFMQRIDVELTESGELVFQQGLADPSQARTVRVQQGVPVATDGPFAESRESLVGFWVVDVETDSFHGLFAPSVIGHASWFVVGGPNGRLSTGWEVLRRVIPAMR
jgi:YCII-related domain